jgi:hypothetical protein
MNKIHTLPCLVLASALLLSLQLPARAADDPIAYRYTQTGFADGASVSGWFVGHDGDADGMLYAFELSDFSLSFSGNRAVPSFTMGMEQRAGLVFDVAAANLMHLHAVGPDETRALEYDAFGWPGFNIPGRVSSNLDGLVSISWERMTLEPISAVPEPAPLTLWLSGLVAMGLVARRHLPGGGTGRTNPDRA